MYAKTQTAYAISLPHRDVFLLALLNAFDKTRCLRNDVIVRRIFNVLSISTAHVSRVVQFFRRSVRSRKRSFIIQRRPPVQRNPPSRYMVVIACPHFVVPARRTLSKGAKLRAICPTCYRTSESRHDVGAATSPQPRSTFLKCKSPSPL